MRLLITGGTGFLGSYLTRHAVRESGVDAVVVFDKYIDAGRIEDVLDRVTVVERDVCDAEAVRETIEHHRITHVAHFAFILGSPPPDQMLPYVQVQCLGAANVLEAARKAGVRRVAFASSVAAYGEQSAETLTEDLAGNPLEPYGFCKVWAEALGRHYTRSLGLEVVSLRYGSTYGLGRAQRGSYKSGLLTLPRDLHYMARVEAVARGQSIEMPCDDALADWTYAGDAALAAWLALTAPHLPHHLYNVCAEQRPVGAFTAALRAALPDAAIRTNDAERPGRAHAHMDGSRLKQDLGFAPRFSLREGVEDYIQRIRAYDRYVASVT